jgi:hypothetical protein
MDLDRPALRAALLDAAPWLAAADVGPRAVDAGTCDRCHDLPRLLPTCGPGAPEALCRDCATTLGDDAWCAGHHDDGVAARAWADALPERWADAVVLWWVATGELRLDAGAVAASAAPWPAVRAAIGR